MNESDKAVMQHALDAMLGYKPHSLTHTKDMNSAFSALRKAIAQPEQQAQHDLQKQLADLHQYEEIAEFYAQCAISPEALRDWVSERMDMPAIAQPEQPTIPQGYVLVPIEPTLKMLAAIGWDDDVDLMLGHAVFFSETKAIYAAMIAAAIAQPKDKP